MKDCKVCLKNKEDSDFRIGRRTCLECYKIEASPRSKEYYQKNKDKVKAKTQEYRRKNAHKISEKRKLNRPAIRKQEQDYLLRHPERAEKKRQFSKEWYSRNIDVQQEKNRQYRNLNKDKIKEYETLRRKDPKRKLESALRIRLNRALKGGYKSGSAVRDLGCSVEFLKQHLESKFQPGMTWENHSRDGWHIDHIVPLSSFDLADREQLLKACHYTNLQPLWALDNIRKGGTAA